MGILSLLDDAAETLEKLYLLTQTEFYECEEMCPSMEVLDILKSNVKEKFPTEHIFFYSDNQQYIIRVINRLLLLNLEIFLFETFHTGSMVKCTLYPDNAADPETVGALNNLHNSLYLCELIHRTFSDLTQFFFLDLAARDTALALVNHVEKNYNDINYFILNNKQYIDAEIKFTEPHAFLSQNLVVEKNLKPLLMQALDGVRTKALLLHAKCSRVFISYAWPFSSSDEDRDIQSYLKNLQNHLFSAGIICYLDVIDSNYGASIDQHMQRLQKSDIVLLIGTPTLKKKIESSRHHFIKNEFLLMISSKKKIFPLLIIGDYEKSFPCGIAGNKAIEDWRHGSYLNHLKTLIQKIYQIPDNSYQDLWKKIDNRQLTNFSIFKAHENHVNTPSKNCQAIIEMTG